MEPIEQLTSIRHADPAEWDALAGDELFWRHAWLAILEENSTQPNKTRYFIAREGSRIQAAAACRAPDNGASAAGIDHVLFGRFAPLARALRLGVSPALMCGTGVGLASPVRVRADVSPPELRQTIEAMMRAMLESARAEGRTLCFRNLQTGETALDDALKDHGFVRAAEMPYTLMNVVWSTFGEYVRDLKKTHPATAKNIPRETNRTHSRGIALRRLEHPGDLTPRLHQLLRDHYVRLNSGEFPFGESFLPNLCERLGDAVVLFTAFDGDLPIGISIGIRDRHMMYLLFIGMDHERRKDSLAYFQLAYNEPIRYAIESGVRSLYCGKLLYELKFRRGFHQVPLDMCLRLRGPIRRALIRQIAAGQKMRVKSMVGASNPAR